MKMWKKLAACVLAAAMALTLLTACGGGGGSASGGSVVRDKAKEDQAISWVQEYAANNGVTLEKNDAVGNAAAAGLSDMVKALNIQMGKAEGDYQAAYKAAATSMGNALANQKKMGVPASFAYKEADFTKENVIKTMDAYGYVVMSQLAAAKITPKTVGAAVTVQNEMVYVVFIIAN